MFSIWPLTAGSPLRPHLTLWMGSGHQFCVVVITSLPHHHQQSAFVKTELDGVPVPAAPARSEGHPRMPREEEAGGPCPLAIRQVVCYPGIEQAFLCYMKSRLPGAPAMPRTILHLDLDAFFCAVEEQHDPSLAGKPFAVGGRPEERGVVASCSYAARKSGIHSAMPMSQARRRCPTLLIVPSHFASYRAASTQVMARLKALTPLVEQLSIDEAFLDVTALETPGEMLARQLQQTIRDELGLPCSLGVATNKLVAKIATDVGKAAAHTGSAPNALCVVPPGTEAAFLAPLPTRTLWGVGPRTVEQLAALGIRTIGDLARHPLPSLIRQFGKHGAAWCATPKAVTSAPFR